MPPFQSDHGHEKAEAGRAQKKEKKKQSIVDSSYPHK
jgi:hypothetical protein